MAKKRAKLDASEGADFFENTQAAPPTQEAPEIDPVSSYGVGLRGSEWKRFEEIADILGIKKHAVAAYGLRYFLKHYESGEIQPVQKPRLPGL